MKNKDRVSRTQIQLMPSLSDKTYMGIDLDQKQVRRNSEDWAITLSHDFSKPTIKAVNQITMNPLHLLIFFNFFFFYKCLIL